MPIINKLDNVSSVVLDGKTINSNTVETILALPPTITKAVDKLTANIGDTLKYTITITNVSLNAINNLAFTDKLPGGCSYVEGSFKVNNTAATPRITDNTLTYTIPNVAALGIVTITINVTVTGGSQ